MKKPGGYTGPYSLPSDTAAPGAWVSPTEVYAQQLIGTWPDSREAGSYPYLVAGDIIEVLATGVLDNVNAISTSSGSLVIASGGLLNRTTYSGLFARTGTRFGVGNGSTTFNTINIPSNFSYLQGTVTSGLTFPANYQASGILPDHTHVCFSLGSGSTNPSNGDFTYNYGGAGIQTSPKFPTRENKNSAPQNEGLHQQVIHCLVAKDLAEPPIGSLVPYLFPTIVGPSNVPASVVPNGYLVPSGQAISRSVYFKLFQRIGTLYGSGNGSTTFNIPNFQGLFLRGSQSANYITLSGSAGLPSGFINSRVGAHMHTINNITIQGNPPVFNSGGGYVASNTPSSTDTSDSNIGGVETRHRNVNVIYYLVALANI
jgi:microcystin-dependent protein